MIRMGSVIFQQEKLLKTGFFSNFRREAANFFSILFSNFRRKSMFLAIFFSIFCREKMKKSFLAILVKFLFSNFFKQFSPQSTEHFQHFFCNFRREAPKICKFFKNNRKIHQKYVVFSNFIQQFSPRSGENSFQQFLK